jgi:hypothetical protein
VCVAAGCGFRQVLTRVSPGYQEVGRPAASPVLRVLEARYATSSLGVSLNLNARCPDQTRSRARSNNASSGHTYYDDLGLHESRMVFRDVSNSAKTQRIMSQIRSLPSFLAEIDSAAGFRFNLARKKVIHERNADQRPALKRRSKCQELWLQPRANPTF